MYTIQEATTEHVQEIVALWTKLMNIHKEMDEDFFIKVSNNFNVYKNNLEISLSINSSKVFVAFAEDKLVGYITAELIKDNNSSYNSIPYCEIGDIMIEEDFQDKGLGNDLLKEIKKWSTSEDIYNIRLNVFSKNQKALHFFKKQGFDNLFANLELKM